MQMDAARGKYWNECLFE